MSQSFLPNITHTHTKPVLSSEINFYYSLLLLLALVSLSLLSQPLSLSLPLIQIPLD
jgi:hypothetical protein